MKTFFLKIVISLLLIYFVFSKVGSKHIYHVLVGADPRYIIVAIIISMVALFINTLSWKALLYYTGIKKNIFSLFSLNLKGVFYSTILPGGPVTGDVIKLYKSLHLSDKKNPIVLSVIIDRAMGLVASTFLAIIGLTFTTSTFSEKKTIGLFLYLMAAGCLFFLACFIPFINDFFSRAIRKVRGSFVTTLTESIQIYRGKYKALFLSFISSTFFHILYILGAFLLARSLAIHVSVADIAWALIIINIAIFVPISIAGLGVRELGFSYLFGLLGINAAQATSLSLLLFVAGLANMALGGLLELTDHFYFFRAKK
ncbi:flippase-like domain-containing protein [Candidatus Parcubacteria bacterium]|nr:flippase-like domain-containing protein [Candidatus Parcubacteria bacterium]